MKDDQPYPSYKNSNISWLGNIPIHWKIQRLKYTVKLINENVDELEIDFPYIGLEHIESWTGKLLTQEMQKIYGQSKIFRTGDVLFGKLRPYLAKVIRITFNGQCTGELLVMRPKLITQDFLFYYLLSREFIEIVNSSTYGAKMPRANWDFIGNLPILLLPEAEQYIITEFLDFEIQKIDSVIRRKKQQIELLQEKRTVLAEQVITKGLDPKVQMKDSGIEYLVKIPKHWNVRKLKYVASTKFSNVDKHIVDGELPVRLCNYTDVYYNDYITEDLDFMKATAKPIEIKKYVLKKGDVIITKDSETWDDIAVPAYVSMDFNDVLCGYHLAQIRPNTKIVDGKYLYRSFSVRGINDQFRIEATGVTRYGLGQYSLCLLYTSPSPRD